MKNRLDGTIFEKMVISGYNSLVAVEKDINAMNVFPVADGDTGTNMRLTLEHGIKNANKTRHLGDYLGGLSKEMLLGARGNSGVILSQIFKGMYTSLARDSIADPTEIRDALISAYLAAYNAVLHPVEGTLLTVAREGIENIKGQIYGKTQIPNLFSMYLAEMKKSLANTPNILSVLKEAGVVDSGALGYITIVDGMVNFLYGDDKLASTLKLSEVVTETKGDSLVVHESGFNEDSTFDDGYCMEFLLQLMNVKNYREVFNIKTYKAALKPLGESIVVIMEDSIVKVHIHTFNPAPIITLSQAFGEFISFKLENMTLQHNEISANKVEEIKTQGPAKDFGIIAVVDGEGIESAYKDLGADIVIQGGKSMNVSTGEFKNAFELLNAKTTLVLPNNPNSFGVAEQAAMLSNKNVVLLPAQNVVEGFFALSMDIGDYEDVDYRIDNMKKGMESIDVMSISTAVKDYNSDDFKCVVGEKVGMLNGKMIATSNKSIDLLVSMLEKFEEMESKSAFVVFLGKGADCSEEEITDALTQKFEDKDVQVIDGGQDVYEIMVGLI